MIEKGSGRPDKPHIVSSCRLSNLDFRISKSILEKNSRLIGIGD